MPFEKNISRYEFPKDNDPKGLYSLLYKDRNVGDEMWTKYRNTQRFYDYIPQGHLYHDSGIIPNFSTFSPSKEETNFKYVLQTKDYRGKIHNHVVSARKLNVPKGSMDESYYLKHQDFLMPAEIEPTDIENVLQDHEGYTYFPPPENSKNMSHSSMTSPRFTDFTEDGENNPLTEMYPENENIHGSEFVDQLTSGVKTKDMDSTLETQTEIIENAMKDFKL